MKILPTTIYSKGLLLIAVPLLAEIAFGVTLVWLQHRFDSAIESERAAQSIIFHTNEMWLKCSEMMLKLAYFNIFGGSKPENAEAVSQMNREYEFLKKSVADDRIRAADLERIRSLTLEVIEFCRQLRPVADAGQSAISRLFALKANVDVLAAARGSVGEVGPLMQELRRPQLLQSSTATAEVEHMIPLIQRIMFAVVSTSFVLAVLLFLYFMKSINNGLQALLENTELFKQGRELKPVRAKGDELEHLDVAFHKMAEEITAAQQQKQAILAMISYDLKTPLTSVMAFFALLEEGALGALPDQAIAAAREANRDLERVMSLIMDLLSLERMEAGKVTIQPVRLSINEIVLSAADRVRELARETAIEVCGIDNDVAVYGDRDLLGRALVNLLSHAVNGSAAGSAVRVQSSRQDDSVELRVTYVQSDTPVEDVDGLFDRYRAAANDKLNLELPLAREIIKLHGGSA
ncbi:MAG TPA: HAMP domain-containing sensor histidine kinase, partial [Candidatus Obscuribacterales bacterium]